MEAICSRGHCSDGLTMVTLGDQITPFWAESRQRSHPRVGGVGGLAAPAASIPAETWEEFCQVWLSGVSVMPSEDPSMDFFFSFCSTALDPFTNSTTQPPGDRSNGGLVSREGVRRKNCCETVLGQVERHYYERPWARRRLYNRVTPQL